MESDLISRNTVLSYLSDVWYSCKWTTSPFDAAVAEALESIIKEVEHMKTVDAEPVQHGRWETPFGSYCTPHCTKCGWHIPYSEDSVLDARNYCPNCGAKMDGEDINVHTK